MRKYLSHTFFFFLFAVLAHAQQTEVFKEQLDSIHKLRRLTENENLDLETRILHAKTASTLSHKTGIDSVILKSNMDLAWIYLQHKKYSKQSRDLNHKNLKMAYHLKDSSRVAFISNYLAYYFDEYNGVNSDSSYYYYNNALKIYDNLNPETKSIDDIIGEVEVLDGINFLQQDELDYLGSQATSIKAINLLNKLPDGEEKFYNLCDLYSGLGVNLKRLKHYEKGLEYYKKGLEISKKLEDNWKPYLYININIAELYKDKGDYKQALNIYNQLLGENRALENKDPESYGSILNNVAHTKFLSGDKDHRTIDSLFTTAYAIFNDLDLSYEISASGNDMADYYYAIGEKAKALELTSHSYELAKTGREYREVLRALTMLSNLKEGDSGKAYLHEYIRLNDSLITKERQNRNKYARIQYETDQYIKETERLNTQNVLVIIIAMILVLLTLLIYFIKRQQTKHELLIYEREQQEATQQIYELLLNQQSKLEEGRLKERHRISEEVHDGILSHLFGARLGLGFLPIEGDTETKRQFQDLLVELQEVEREMRDISHKLKQDDSITATNFEALLKEYVATQSKRGRINYKIDNSVVWEKIPNTVKIALYRLVQEAMKNIITHAKAKMVTIDLKTKEDKLEIKIIDNGIGFDAQTFKEGIGLRNMASRIEKLKGEFTIISQKELGTTIQCSIPIIRR